MITEYEGLKLIDLSKDHAYSGALARVTFGDPDGDRVVIDLTDYCVCIFIQEREHYCFNLERIQTSAQMLDLIMQIASKTWATPQILGLLVIALNEAFSPQSCLCSFGRNLQMPKQAIQKHIERQLRRLIGWYQFDPEKQLRDAGFEWE